MYYASACHLEELIVGHVGGQSCQGLPPTATHAHQEGVALGMLNDTTDAINMLNGKSAEDRRWSLADGGQQRECQAQWNHALVFLF